MNNMTYKINKGWKTSDWLFLMVICQTITGHPLVSIGNSEASLQLHHIVCIVGLLFLLNKGKKLLIPFNLFTVINLYAIIISMLLIPKFGFGSSAINLIYAFIVYIVTYNYAPYYDLNKIYRIFYCAGLIYAILIAINTAINFPAVISCIKGERVHPNFETLIGGGENIEASFLAFFTIFFLYNKKFWYWLFAFIISVAYASRAGIILCILSFVMFMLSQFIRIDSHKIKLCMFFCVSALIVGVAIFKLGIFNHIFKRFIMTGTEEGSLARLKMWKMVPLIIRDNPFGCGFGNAIEQVRRYSGIVFSEANIHNVYLQFLTELGPFGILMLICLLLNVGYVALKTRFCNQICNLLLLFFAGFLIQFRGTEPLFFMMMALFYAWKNCKFSVTNDCVNNLCLGVIE